MQKVAQRLSAADIAALARYLAAQKPAPGGACAGRVP